MDKRTRKRIERRKVVDPDLADEIWCYRIQPHRTVIEANEFGKLRNPLECSITLEDAKIWWLDAWYGGETVDVWEFKTNKFKVMEGEVEVKLGVIKKMKWVKIEGFTIARLIDVWRYKK